MAYAHQLLRSSVRSVTATILQAPVSDREFVAANMPDVPAPLNPPEGATLDDFVPADLSQRWGAKAGVTYRRWNSLTAKPEGDEVDLDTSEDVFSSDLSDARWRNVFAPFDAPVLVLLGDKDHSYPSGVEPSKLLERFRVALGEERFSKDSVVLKGANHAVEGEAARKVMIETIGRFLQAL